MQKILILKTGRNWLLRSCLQELELLSDNNKSLSILTNSDTGMENIFTNIYRYPKETKLSVTTIDSDVLASIKNERFDKVIYLMAYKIPAFYQHIEEVIKYFGIENYQAFFKHVPNGDYDRKFKEGYWNHTETDKVKFCRVLLEKAGYVSDSKIKNNLKLGDLASGLGVMSDFFHRTGVSEVYALDQSFRGLQETRKLNPAIHRILGDLSAVPIKNNTFDCLFMRAITGADIHNKHYLVWGKNFLNLLKSGGCLIQVIPSIDMSGDNKCDPLIQRYLSPENLNDYFSKSGFSKYEHYFTDEESINKFGISVFSNSEIVPSPKSEKEPFKFFYTISFAWKK